MEFPPSGWWARVEPVWDAPELDLGDGRVLVLDTGDPFPPEEWPGFPDH